MATENVSMGNVRRFQVKVSLADHYARESVQRVAEAVIADLTAGQAVNAVNVLFYGPGTSTTGAYDVARVEWAPNGRWSDAHSVRAGNYATFRYSVSYNPPPPSPSESQALSSSGRTGLLGVPLPEGATLTQRTEGDPAAGRDPSERYAIDASADQILAFFSAAMPREGWMRDGPAHATGLFFTKGNLMIGVLTNRDGSSFTLMGS